MTGYLDDVGSDRRRGKSGGGRDRERGRGKPPPTKEQDSTEERDFTMDRLDVCREWNPKDRCKRGHAESPMCATGKGSRGNVVKGCIMLVSTSEEVGTISGVEEGGL